MIRNPKISNLSMDILTELKGLLNKQVNGYSVTRGDRGRKVEQFIYNTMLRNNIDGFEINDGKGKDCSHFEIKSLQMKIKSDMSVVAPRPCNCITISGTHCDIGKKYADSNFREKASLILFVCLDNSGKITDLRFSNYTQAELALGYYGSNNIVCGTNGKKFNLNKKYFLTHTLSLKDMVIANKSKVKIVKDFFYWMKQIKRQSESHSFTGWLKSL